MSDIIFVNSEKKLRAQYILDLIVGVKRPQDDNEVERREKFTGILSEAKVDPKSKDALQFTYEKLGGLIRTSEEQKAFEEKVKESKKKKVSR